MRPEDIITVNKHALKPGQTFRFHCTQCGDCCRHREDILLTRSICSESRVSLASRPAKS